MALLMDSIEEETLMKNNIRFRIIGEKDKLPVNVAERLQQCIKRTSVNTGMCLVLALSYSSKWEPDRSRQTDSGHKWRARNLPSMK